MEVVQDLCTCFLPLTWAASGRFRLEETVAQQIHKTCRLQISCAYGYSGAVNRLGGQKKAWQRHAQRWTC